MASSPRASQVAVSEQAARQIATNYVRDQRLAVGRLTSVRYTLHSVRSGGYWSVQFEYAGPAVKSQANVVHTPPLDSPVTILVDGATGEAEILHLL
jgi:hypothetical protein